MLYFLLQISSQALRQAEELEEELEEEVEEHKARVVACPSISPTRPTSSNRPHRSELYNFSGYAYVKMSVVENAQPLCTHFVALS